jgi:hypothetical protein
MMLSKGPNSMFSNSVMACSDAGQIYLPKKMRILETPYNTHTHTHTHTHLLDQGTNAFENEMIEFGITGVLADHGQNRRQLAHDHIHIGDHILAACGNDTEDS